jgi:hypothetical protein
MRRLRANGQARAFVRAACFMQNLSTTHAADIGMRRCLQRWSPERTVDGGNRYVAEA